MPSKKFKNFLLPNIAAPGARQHGYQKQRPSHTLFNIKTKGSHSFQGTFPIINILYIIYQILYCIYNGIYQYIYNSIVYIIYNSIYFSLFIYIYIYVEENIQKIIYKNLKVKDIVRLPHFQSRDSQGQEMFLAASADKETCYYDTKCSNHHPSLSTLW